MGILTTLTRLCQKNSGRASHTTCCTHQDRRPGKTKRTLMTLPFPPGYTPSNPIAFTRQKSSTTLRVSQPPSQTEPAASSWPPRASDTPSGFFTLYNQAQKKRTRPCDDSMVPEKRHQP